MKNSSNSLSVVIPCYNESRALPELIKNCAEVHSEHQHVEFILVDNGSSDDTEKILIAAAKKYFWINPVFIKENEGYGNGIKRGIEAASGDVICWTHADLQTRLSDILVGLQWMRKGGKQCFVKGSRQGRPLVDAFFTFGMSIFETLLLRTTLWDINAQPNMFHKSLKKAVLKGPDDFAFDLYVYHLAKKHNFKVFRFPVTFLPRKHGTSSWNDGIVARIRFI